jgi:hypothetical protein
MEVSLQWEALQELEQAQVREIMKVLLLLK